MLQIIKLYANPLIHILISGAAAGDAAPAAGGLTVTFDERRGVAWVIDPATGNAARSTPRETSKELDVCAQCHARRGQFSNDYRPGEPFTDHYLPALLGPGLYHPDGQQLDEVFNWGSFLSSRMHEKGVTCGDCHDPHGGHCTHLATRSVRSATPPRSTTRPHITSTNKARREPPAPRAT